MLHETDSFRNYLIIRKHKPFLPKFISSCHHHSCRCNETALESVQYFIENKSDCENILYYENFC